jgi:Fe-S-cluster-containing hydrogenase component 2
LLKRLFNFTFISDTQEGKNAKVICSENAIMVDDKTRIYYSYRCDRCKSCVGECPFGALAFIGE